MSERADNIGQRESLKHIRKRLEAELLSHRDSMRAALPLGGELTDIDCDYILSLALAVQNKLVELRGVNAKIAILTREIDG